MEDSPAIKWPRRKLTCCPWESQGDNKKTCRHNCTFASRKSIMTKAAFESPHGCGHLAGSPPPQHVWRSQPWLQPWPPAWGKRFSNQIFQNQFSSCSKVLAVIDNNFLPGFLNYQIKMLNGFKPFCGQDSPSSGILRGICKEIWLISGFSFPRVWIIS